MKKLLAIISVLFLALTITYTANAQSVITLSGGYTFANIQDVDLSTSGWRINFLYEYETFDGHLFHGLNVGYIQTKGVADEGQPSEAELKSGHWPIFYAPKYIFLDEDAFRPFIKGALGIHFSDYDRTGNLGGTIDTGDSGFYGGIGAGISKRLGGKILINVEYEWAYLSNSWFKNGSVHNIMAGVGISFY